MAESTKRRPRLVARWREKRRLRRERRRIGLTDRMRSAHDDNDLLTRAGREPWKRQ
jgi:hypothetical protein